MRRRLLPTRLMDAAIWLLVIVICSLIAGALVLVGMALNTMLESSVAHSKKEAAMMRLKDWPKRRTPILDEPPSPTKVHHRPAVPCSPGCATTLPNGSRCGFRTGIDCPRPYLLREVALQAARSWGANESAAAAHALTMARNRARTACSSDGGDTPRLSGKLRSGAWCLNLSGSSTMRLPRSSYLLPRGHSPPDRLVVDTLNSVLHPRGKAWVSVTDLGAGVGQYGRHLMEQGMPRELYRGVDGAGNVEEASESLVRFGDLTERLLLAPSEWVLSLEAGEHVPRSAESAFVTNLHALNCAGIMLSWATLTQGGHGHVNNHDPAYTRRTFESLGYDVDEALTAKLRAPRQLYHKSHSTGLNGTWVRGRDDPRTFVNANLAASLVALRRRVRPRVCDATSSVRV